MLHRPRLAAQLRSRWHRRLTLVVAEAGFGKSGLIVEALEDNRREPLGHDAWVGCQEEDVRLDRFFEAVFTAVRGEPPLDWPVDLDDAVHRVADAVWSHAPFPVSIVVDDAHLLTRGSPGADLLEALVRRLPANANFLLASRGAPAFATAKLVSTGDAVVIGEADLVMTPEELRAFAEHRGRPDLDLGATGGWPALAELAVHTGADGSSELIDYLTNEVLDGLAPDAVEALAVLSEVGPLSAAQLTAVMGGPVAGMGEVVRLPLVDTSGDLLEAHALWHVATEDIDPARLAEARGRAARLLREEGSTERAYGLAVASGDRHLAVEVLGDLCRMAVHMATDIDLRSCVADLPDDARGAPAARLAMAFSAEDDDWSSHRDRLVSISVELADEGANALELLALTRLGVLGWQAGDLTVADHLLPRVERLARSGDALAVALVTLGAALMAEVSDDLPAMWSAMEAFGELDVPEPIRTMGARYRSSLHLQYGDPSEALRFALAAESTAPEWLRVELRVVAMWACWLLGDVRAAAHWSDRLVTPAPSGGGTVATVARANRDLVDAWLVVGSGGASAVSDLLDEAARARSDGLLVPSTVLVLAAAARSVASGDEEGAAEILARAAADRDLGGPRVRPAVIRGLALVWVLAPDLRDRLDGFDLGRAGDVGRRAARALVEARAAGATGPAADGWRASARAVLSDPALPARLPPAWVAELAARYVGEKPTDDRVVLAQDALDRLGPLSPEVLRRLVAQRKDRDVAAGASIVLARRTPVSEGRFVLRLLGPMLIEHDGEQIDQPDWRRDRVRGLFSLIARQGTITRRSAIESLWPDLDPDAGANNLRVTLSYLQKVLEPSRTKHEVAYHVRTEGAALRFTGRSSWTIDVEEFERLLDTAERDDRRGESSIALEGYLSALGWYRGPFLDDIAVTAADEIERDRLRSRYVRAVVRTGSLLLAVGRVEEAQRSAVAAQAADPWSEGALFLQAECFLAVGDRAAALRTRQRALTLSAELGLPESPELRRLGRVLDA